MSRISDAIMSTNVSYITSGTGLILGLSWNQWLSIASGCFLVLTYLTSLYFQYSRNKREKEIHNLKMKKQKEDLE